MNLTKSFFIDQHGCAKNQTDGELITGFLIDAGYDQTFDAEKADLIIINSCGFIESAKKESIDAIYNVKSAYPNAKIILAGCLAERYSELMYDSIPELDGIIGNGDLSQIVQVVNNVFLNKREVFIAEQKGVMSGKRPVLFNFKGSAFVKITEGCSNYCSFCAIPLIRGELRSRPADEIIQEITNLVKNGIYEINLIGQDLAAYGTGKDDNVFGDGVTPLPKLNNEGENLGTEELSGLARLMKMICQIDGNFVVRLLYIHPDHFNYDILPIIKQNSRFLHYFDIPFQSGDDNVIKLMNRKGSAKSYVKMIQKIREELPDCVIRTTFLTGFPGETESAHKNTCDFLKQIQSDWSGCFDYSREEDTPAYSFKKRVSKKEAKKRADELSQIQQGITEERLKVFKNQEVLVLVEEVIDTQDDSTEGLAIGRSWFQAPEVDGCVVIRYEKDFESEVNAVKPGNVIKANVLAINNVDLDARFISLEKSFESSLRFLPQ